MTVEQKRYDSIWQQFPRCMKYGIFFSNRSADTSTLQLHKFAH